LFAGCERCDCRWWVSYLDPPYLLTTDRSFCLRFERLYLFRIDAQIFERLG